MARRVTYTRDLLTRTAAASSSLVDMMRRLGTPLGSGPRRYLRERLRHHGIDTAHFVDEPLPHHQPRAYTEALLTEAAARSHSIRDMLDYMGVPPYDSAYTHLRRKLDQFGIDASHFTRHRHGASLLPRGELERAVAASPGLAGVTACLALTDNGTSRRAVKRSIEAYGLSTEHFTGQGHRRGLPPPTAGRPTTSSGNENQVPDARERRSYAVPSMRRRCPGGARSAASGTPGRASGSSWRSTTSTVTGWTAGWRTSATCAPRATARRELSPAGQRTRPSPRNPAPGHSKVGARARTPAGQRAPV